MEYPTLFTGGTGWYEPTYITELTAEHEFGHQYSGDHLSEAYHEGLCLLGAKLKKLALEKPGECRRLVE